MERKVSLLRLAVDHPRSSPSRITLPVVLHYLRGAPIATIVLSDDEALTLAEQALSAVRIMRSLR